MTPFGRIDDLLTVNLLARVPITATSQALLRIQLTADGLSSCGAEWHERLRDSGAKTVLLFEPLDLLCPIPGARVIQMSGARRDWLGRVAGWNQLPDLGGSPRRASHWVRPYASQALPTVDGVSFVNRHVDASILRDKVVMFTWARKGVSDPQLERALQYFAAAISTDSERRAVPPFSVSLVAAAWGGLWYWTHRRRGQRWGLLVALGGFSAMVFGSAAAAVWWQISILPLFTLTGAFLAMSAAVAVPALRAERRTLHRANQLVERAALLRLRGLDQIDDAEFYARIANLAEQWHPANIVLVAQLPPKKWHLVFWNNGSAGENLIEERRRDIRRTPYCDEQGIPAIRIVRNYLAVKDMPVLVVPLMALGDIEGYVFLCGDRAEIAFRADPGVAHRMSLELAMLMRRRRLGRATAEELGEHRGGSTRARALAAGAQTVTEEMELLGIMVREAPLGLLLADAFGHVRMVGKIFADTLSAYGVVLPTTQNDAMLAPGTLTLLTVIERLSGGTSEEAQKRIGQLAATPEGFMLRLKSTEPGGVGALVLHCRALRKNALSVNHVAGYVAVLSEGEQRLARTNVVALSTTEELGAFALVEAIAEVAAAANRSARRRIILEPTASLSQAIGKRTKLVQAMRAFLIEAATYQSPVIVLREKAREIEIIIHDLDLGVPMGAVERVMNAPNHPPSGLESLGRLILAVEESHGVMRVADGRGWGMRLVLRLHRARSVVMAGNSRYPTAMAVSEGLARSSGAPPPNPRSRRPPPIAST